MPRKMSVMEKFEKWTVPEPNSGCWIWIGALNSKGYGRIAMGDKLPLAHRFFYKFFKGEIPSGLELDHLCRVPCCVNPDHLEPVTRRVNILRGNGPKVQVSRFKLITHCRHGHEYTEENTYRDKTGRRQCRECNRLKQRRYYWDRQ